MRKTICDGIAFYEGCPAEATRLQNVEARIGGVLKSAQLSTLDDVKRALATQAKQFGANAVVDFRYGQKSVGILASLFSRDDVNWHGNGVAAVVRD
jgi:hypothetical protein